MIPRLEGGSFSIRNPPGLFAAMIVLGAAACDRPRARLPPPARLVDATSAPAATPDERGRMIYLHGESPSGRAITARIGDGPPLPARTLACVQCHGSDGRGRPEGGVTPSDINWANITRTYGVTHASGRRHPAYTQSLFGRAVTMGWDPAGQTLSVAMPRYQIAPEDLSDLIAYVRKIDHATVAGVSDSSIRIGIALPTDWPGVPRADAVVRTITSYIETINQSGGIFRRRLEPVLIGPTGDQGLDVFVAIGGFTPDGDAASARVGKDRVPSVRVYPAPELARPTDREESFALISGYAGQVRALARFAADRWLGSNSAIALVHGSAESRVLAREVAGQLSGAGAGSVVVEILPSTRGALTELAERLRAKGCQAILLIGPADRILVGELINILAARSRDLAILVPMAVADKWLDTLPTTPAGRLFAAAPMPSWIGTDAADALAAVKVVVEGLKSAGRNLDRESFIKAVERLSTTAFNDAIPSSFGPGCRVGARGASIIGLSRGGLDYKIITPRIDPGPTADDRPDESRLRGS